MSLTKPIVEGAYYRAKNKRIVGPAQWEDERRKGWWIINGASYAPNGQASDLYPEAPDLEFRVYLVPTDPREVVTELCELGDEANRRSAFGHGSAPSYHSGRSEAFGASADLVASKLLSVCKTTFECRTCGVHTNGWSDGTFAAPGWGRIERVDGPNSICPECITSPDALGSLREEYPFARVGIGGDAVGLE